MGAVSEQLADQVVLTNDNPRTETAESRLSRISLKGFSNRSIVTVKYDRSDAITNTFLNAHKNDVILIAGKGHETTQQIGASLLPFSDRELARRLTEQAIMISMSLSKAAMAIESIYSGEDIIFSGCSTDSRTIEKGNLFIALKWREF